MEVDWIRDGRTRYVGILMEELEGGGVECGDWRMIVGAVWLRGSVEREVEGIGEMMGEGMDYKGG